MFTFVAIQIEMNNQRNHFSESLSDGRLNKDISKEIVLRNSMDSQQIPLLALFSTVHVSSATYARGGLQCVRDWPDHVGPTVKGDSAVE